MNTTAIQTFTSPLGFSIRTVERAGEPWFVAADVCRALEIANPSQAINGNSRDGGGLDDDERGVCSTYTPSGDQNMLVVSESGLYSLIFKSRKAEARTFKRWVTRDVLPAIRKTGRYQLQAPTPEEAILGGFRAIRAEMLAAVEKMRGEVMLEVQKENKRRPRPLPWTHPRLEALKADILAREGSFTMNMVFQMLRERDRDIPRNKVNERAVEYILRESGLFKRHLCRVGIYDTWFYDRLPATIIVAPAAPKR